MKTETQPQPLEDFERVCSVKGARLGGGDAIALYELPLTVQEAFAAGFNRRSEITELLAAEQAGLDPSPAVQRDLLAAAIAEAAVKRGIWSPGFSATGPQLLQVLQDLAEADQSAPDLAPAG